MMIERGLPYWKVVGAGRELPHDGPPFLTFSDPIRSLFYVQLELIHYMFLSKNRFVSITFSARDNLT